MYVLGHVYTHTHARTHTHTHTQTHTHTHTRTCHVFCSSSPDVTSTIPNYSELKKRDFDNVAQYLQRKEERAKDEECMRKD